MSSKGRTFLAGHRKAHAGNTVHGPVQPPQKSKAKTNAVEIRYPRSK